MKIQKIDIENFGLYSQRSFELGQSGFHLFYGPNEAGKSTLLELFRDVLFGFPHQTPFSFASHSGEMAAVVDATLADGREFQYRQRKGRKDRVTGQFTENGQPIDEKMLGRLLGSMTKEMYVQMLGFSSDELAAGQESLKEASLDEALFGSALGNLSRFQQASKAIDKEIEDLFKANKSASKPAINKLNKTITEQRQQLTKTIVDPTEYKKLCADRDEANEKVDSLKQKREQNARALQQCKKQLEAIPLLQGLTHVANELAQLPEVADSVLADELEFQRITDQLANVSQELEREQAELTELENKKTDTSTERLWKGEQARIRHLFQQLEQVKGCLTDSQAVADAAAGQRTEIGIKLAQLHPDWKPADLKQLSTGLAKRETVSELASLQQQLVAERDKTGEAVALNKQLQAKHEAKLKQLGDVEPPVVLEQVVEQAAEYKATQKQIDTQGEQLLLADRTIKQLQTQLNSIAALNLDDVPTLPVLLESLITEYEQRFETAERNCHEAAKDVDNADNTLRQKQSELAKLENRHQDVTRELLQSARNERDQGWQLIVRKFIVKENCDKEITAWLENRPTDLPAAVEQSIADADQLADRRQELAEHVALHEQLLLDISQQEQQLAELKSIHDERKSDLEKLTQEWQAQWQPCEIVPQSPKVMADWSRLFLQLRNELNEQAQLKRQQDQCQQIVANFEKRLTSALEQPSDDVAAMLAMAREQLTAARDAVRDRRQCLEELPAIEANIEQSNTKLTELETEIQNINTTWARLLDELGWPNDWSIATANTVFFELTEIVGKETSAAENEKRVAKMQATIDDFKTTIEDVCQKLNCEFDKLPAIDAMQALDDGLTTALEKTREQEQVHEAIEACSKRLAQRTTAKKQWNKQHDNILSRAGVTTANDFHHRIETARARQRLTNEQTSLDHDLARVIGDQDKKQFLSSLEDTDEFAIQADTEQLERTLKQLESEFETALQEEGICRQRVESLSENNQALNIDAQLQSSYAELGNTVDQWASLVVAKKLMDEAVEEFGRRNRSDVLSDASAFLSQLTGGRYQKIEAKLDQQSTLLVVDENQKYKEPHELSTGTMQQLYLALRLAFVRKYCRDSEPLPIVLDDILVHFDDERALNALQVLLDLAEDVQVIFLTCHWSRVEMIRRLQPAFEPILLGSRPAFGDEVATTADNLGKKKSTTPRPKKSSRTRVDHSATAPRSKAKLADASSTETKPTPASLFPSEGDDA